MAIHLWPGALNSLDTMQSLASVMTSVPDSCVSDAANLTPEWFVWTPEVSPTVTSILKTTPVVCLSFLLLSPFNLCRQVYVNFVTFLYIFF